MSFKNSLRYFPLFTYSQFNCSALFVPPPGFLGLRHPPLFVSQHWLLLALGRLLASSPVASPCRVCPGPCPSRAFLLAFLPLAGAAGLHFLFRLRTRLFSTGPLLSVALVAPTCIAHLLPRLRSPPKRVRFCRSRQEGVASFRSSPPPGLHTHPIHVRLPAFSGRTTLFGSVRPYGLSPLVSVWVAWLYPALCHLSIS